MQKNSLYFGKVLRCSVNRLSKCLLSVEGQGRSVTGKHQATLVLNVDGKMYHSHYSATAHEVLKSPFLAWLHPPKKKGHLSTLVDPIAWAQAVYSGSIVFQVRFHLTSTRHLKSLCSIATSASRLLCFTTVDVATWAEGVFPRRLLVCWAWCKTPTSASIPQESFCNGYCVQNAKISTSQK